MFFLHFEDSINMMNHVKIAKIKRDTVRKLSHKFHLCVLKPKIIILYTKKSQHVNFKNNSVSIEFWYPC